MVHVIITGGSSGIGLALAALHLTKGDRVTLIGRSEKRLEAAKAALMSETGAEAERLHTGAADVADEPALSAAVLEAERALGPCDTLIASAGMVHPGAFETLASDLFVAQISTNLLGAANAVRSVYTGMKSRRRGTIVLISSGAALIGIHGYTAYCASKSALVGFAEALRMEAEPFGVNIVIAFPPDTDTPQLAGELPMRSPQAAIVMGKVKPWTVEAVARHLYRGVEKGRSQIFFATNLFLLGRFGSLVRPLLYRWFLWQDKSRS